MKFSSLRPEPIDFSAMPYLLWILRRSTIAVFILIYYMYAFVAVMFQVFEPEVINKLSTGPNQQSMPPAYSALLRSPTFNMTTFGFLGGIFVITRTFVSSAFRRPDMPFSWYITRPLQAILIALFIYYAFLAGQLVFYSGGSDPKQEAVNIYAISILAIVAGMFTEQAYLSLKTLSRKLIPSKRQPDEVPSEYIVENGARTDKPTS